MLKKPCLYGSVLRFEGQQPFCTTLKPPCYRCLHPESPPPETRPSCAEAGVFGVVQGLIGAKFQATETLKLIAREALLGRLLLFHALMKFKELKISQNTQYSICGKNPSIAI